MAKIVGIKFKHSGKIYYFDPADVFYKKDSGVIVETARGVEYGRVIIEPKEVPDSAHYRRIEQWNIQKFNMDVE